MRGIKPEIFYLRGALDSPSPYPALFCNPEYTPKQGRSNLKTKHCVLISLFLIHHNFGGGEKKKTQGGSNSDSLHLVILPVPDL